MKFYIETASGDPVKPLEGFKLEDASFEDNNNSEKKWYRYPHTTVEINTLEELLDVANKTGGIMVGWNVNYPPLPPMQFIPSIIVVDAPL